MWSQKVFFLSLWQRIWFQFKNTSHVNLWCMSHVTPILVTEDLLLSSSLKLGLQIGLGLGHSESTLKFSTWVQNAVPKTVSLNLAQFEEKNMGFGSSLGSPKAKFVYTNYKRTTPLSPNYSFCEYEICPFSFRNWILPLLQLIKHDRSIGRAKLSSDNLCSHNPP